MEKGYGILKEAGSADAVQHLAAVGFLFVLNVGVLFFFPLFAGSKTNTYSHENQFILESLSGKEK